MCAVIAAVLATAVQSLRSVHARPRPGMLRYGYRPLVALVVDSARVLAALVGMLLLRRPLHGRFRAVRYRATAGGAEAAARRILTEWGASVAPNVIGIDAERDVLVVHELVRSLEPLDPLELG